MPIARTPVILGNARFTVLASGCVRMEYAWHGRWSEGPSLLVGRRALQPHAAEVVRSGDTLRISTTNLELLYRDDGHPFSAKNLSITHRNARGREEVWTPEKPDRGNLGSVYRSLDHWRHSGATPRFPVEGLLSTDGGHCLVDDARVYWNPEYDWPENLVTRVAFDGYYFAYGNDYKAALKDFITVFGPIPMIPRWALGFWHSRYFAYRDTEFVALAKRYRRAGIPIDVMVIDTDWRKTWGGYDWNRELFPDPRGALRALHRMGLRVTLNDHPGYDNFDSLPDGDTHIPEIRRRLGALPHQGQWACDWSRKEAVKTWRDVLLGPPFDMGMDFWWVDGWIKPPFAVTPLGQSCKMGTNSQFWVNHHYYETASEKTDRRGLILSRWGGIGDHRHPVQFSGDTYSDWATMREQVDYTARSGSLGVAYWSHDIGGFLGKEIDEELFLRWVQFGALSPVFRTHSDHGVREPWKFSVNAVRVFRKAARARTALAPYLYHLVAEAHKTGLPLCRPLFLEFPDDARAHTAPVEYMLGPDLLVIPADGPASKKGRPYRRTAWFPAGRWTEIETGEVVTGPVEKTLAIPIERIPLYARAGSIIPVQRVGDAVGAETPREMHLECYPSREREGILDLYEDDGESLEHRWDRSSRTRIRVRRAAELIEVAIAPPRGTYRGMPKKRTFVIRVRLDAGERVTRAESRVERGTWTRTKTRVVRRALAGEIASGSRYVEIRLEEARSVRLLVCQFRPIR
jgi:alpha-glucosidase (family GH31 glycosyl hydrolase)